MGATFQVNNVVSGNFAQVWIGAELMAECTGITAKVTDNRSDVQIGNDIGSKSTGLKGEGTITVHHVYTHNKTYIENKLKGKDMPMTITAKMNDPNAVGGRTERWIIKDAIFTDVTLFDWTNGNLASREMPFIFLPSQAKVQETI